MLKISEIKVGDIIKANYEGVVSEGEVTDLNHEDKQVCVDTGVQEFWYEPDQLSGIPLDEAQLMKFHFEKHENGDGTVKYSRGPFRILLPKKGDFSNFEIWYREDDRQLHHSVMVHELQNHYHQMTKVELTR